MAIVQLRVDDDLKMKASIIYEKLGIDLSSTVRMFLKRTVMANGIPFSMILPDEDYRADVAMKAMRDINASAKKNGSSELSLDEINEEIAQYRIERKNISQ